MGVAREKVKLKTKIDIAKRMLAEQVDPVFISKVTTLPIEDTWSFKKNNRPQRL